MKKWFGKFMFETVHGWRFIGKPMPPETRRCIFVFAPHTSNWDFYYGMLCMWSLGVPVKIAIKDFWTQFPFGLIVKPLGGVGINRSQKPGRHQVDNLAALFKKHKEIAFVITPEGSRSKRTKWKTGFYHVALRGEVPMVTFRADFSKRTCDFGPVFTEKDSLDFVMKEMMIFFSGSVPFHPEQFSVDLRYV